MEYRTLSSDSRHDVAAFYRGGTVIGNPPNQTIRLNPKELTYKTSWYPVGRKRESIITRNTGRFHLGRIKLTPAEHYDFRCESQETGKTEVFSYITGRYAVIAEARGHLAALCAVIAPTYPALPASAAKEQQALLMENFAQMNSATVDAGMMLAEAGETAAMLISPFTALGKIFKKFVRPRNFRRSVKFRPGDAWGYACQSWLTYRYGIVPFLCDIDSIRKATRDVLEPRHIDYACARHKKTLGKTHSRTIITGARPIPANLFGMLEVDTHSYVHATTYYRVNGQSTGAQLGLDANSIPSLVWELLPFSFVVDWWLDVGTWIRAITPSPGVVPLGSVSSVTSMSTTSVSLSGISHLGPSATYPITPCNGGIQAVSRRYVRSIGPAKVEFPRLQYGLDSWKRKLDSVTLASQPITDLFKKIKR